MDPMTGQLSVPFGDEAYRRALAGVDLTPSSNTTMKEEIVTMVPPTK
jgi:hypothetical protein